MAIWVPVSLRSKVKTIALENKDVYHELSGASAKPQYDVFNLALKGFENLKADSLLEKDSILTIIDMSMASTKSRFWTINLKQKKIIAYSLVAHGKNTGENMAKAFSNKNGSHQTSLGFYKTGGTYIGKHGYSMYLHGLEDGINDLAFERNIVVHGANYVSQEFIKNYGRL